MYKMDEVVHENWFLNTNFLVMNVEPYWKDLEAGQKFWVLHGNNQHDLYLPPQKKSRIGCVMFDPFKVDEDTDINTETYSKFLDKMLKGTNHNEVSR